MIAEAVDTAYTLGWALAAWILLLAAVASLALWTVLVTVCALPAAAYRALTDGVAAGLAATQCLRGTELLPEPQRAPEARPRPSWADTSKEAA